MNTITPAELAERLAALELENQGDAAEALYGDRSKRYNVSRYLSGARPIPRQVVRVLDLLEQVQSNGESDPP